MIGSEIVAEYSIVGPQRIVVFGISIHAQITCVILTSHRYDGYCLHYTCRDGLIQHLCVLGCCVLSGSTRFGCTNKLAQVSVSPHPYICLRLAEMCKSAMCSEQTAKG